MASDPSLIRIIGTLNDFFDFFLVTTARGTNFNGQPQINVPMQNSNFISFW